jgi:hypothetical protein
MSQPGLPKKSRENLVHRLFNSISGIWKSTEIKNVELVNRSSDSKTLDDVNLPTAKEIVPLPSSESNGGDQMANKRWNLSFWKASKGKNLSPLQESKNTGMKMWNPFLVISTQNTAVP